MDFRVTSQSVYSQTIANVRRHFNQIARLQEQATTGKRLLRPSDAPADNNTLLATRAQQARLETDLSNIRDSRTLLDVSVSALREAGNVLTTARDLAIEGSHAINDPTAFEALAQQVDALINRMLDVSNTEYNGQFLFGGTASNAAPFSVDAADNQAHPLSIRYNGSLETGSVLLGHQSPIATLIPGNEIFQLRERGTTHYTTRTGVTAGTGLDSAVGQGTLTVRHTATTYAAGSGVQAGTGSVAGDTIIGTSGAHVLTINDTSGTGASGTVSLNGGPVVNFTNGDTNLKVSGPNGEVVYIDTTSIAPGFNGDVAITADGTLSVDNGATEVAIDFSTNQVVTNSLTGAVTNVNSTNARRTGTEQLDYTGSYDAFQILMALRDELRNKGGLSAPEQAEAISRHIGELDRTREDILGVIGEQSAALENLESLESRLQDIQLESQKQASEIESADISELVLRLQEEQNILQLAFASSARVMDLTLLDFLG